MHNFAYLIFVFASVAALPSSRILNGGIVNVGDLPYAVSIATASGHVCGGFIYNEEWIVTSANCIKSFTAGQLTASVGTVSLNTMEPDQQDIKVKNITINDGFSASPLVNDLALLQLESAIRFTANVQPIGIAAVNPNDNNAVVIGFGATVLDGTSPTVRLREANVNLSADCTAFSSNFNPTTMICAGSTLSSPCPFDEGGPLVQGVKAIGVTSNILAGCSARLGPSIYTRLSAFSDWLDKTAGAQVITTSTTTTTTSPDTTTTTETTTLTSTASTTTTTTLPPTTEYTGFPTVPTAPCIDCVTTDSSIATIFDNRKL